MLSEEIELEEDVDAEGEFDDEDEDTYEARVRWYLRQQDGDEQQQVSKADAYKCRKRHLSV
eukprot:scaffold56078_cov13-Prasinocladus_malaysianus.AAC.1